MGLLDSKKDTEKEDILKVLSTNIEVINQRLAQSNPEYGFSEFTASIKKSMDMMQAQLKGLSDNMKTSEMEMRQLINYNVNQNNQNKAEIVKTITSTSSRVADIVSQNMNQMNRLAAILDDFRKTVEGELAGLNEAVLHIIQSEGTTATTVDQSMSSMKEEMYALMNDFNQKVNQAIQSGEKLDPEVVKELKSMNKNMKSAMTGLGETESPKAVAADPKIVNYITELRKDISKKFEIITDVMKDLVQTNIEYVAYLKDTDQLPKTK